MEDCLKLIKEDFPAIDADIEDYVSAVLDSTCEDLEAVDDVFDGIGEVLHGVDPAKTEKEIRELCARLCFILKPNWTENSTPSFQQRVVPDSGYGDQRPDLVTTELKTAGDTGGQGGGGGDVDGGLPGHRQPGLPGHGQLDEGGS